MQVKTEMKRRILVYTVTAGEGHNSIARTIKDKLMENPDNEVKLVNFFEQYSNKVKVNLINNGYLMACKYLMPAYNYYFKIMQKTNPEKRFKNWFQKRVHKEIPYMLKDIQNFKPDIIGCTHMYGGIAVTITRQKQTLDIPTVQLLTDYTVHPYWESCIGVDYLITPSSSMDKDLILKGFKKNQLISLGLPTREDFSKVQNKIKSREKLGLKENMFTVLLFLGGGGMTSIEKLVKPLIKISKPLQILVVNGKDKKSKKSIDNFIKKKKQKTIHEFKSYGFIDFISSLMDASDIVVNKCGCTVANEVLNKNKPFVIIHNLPQQELDNMKYLVQNKAAIYLTKKQSLNSVICDLMNHPSKMKALEENTKKLSRPTATKDICSFIEKTADDKKNNYNPN